MAGPFLVTYVTLWVIVVVELVAIFALYHHFGQMYLSSPVAREEQGPRVDARLKSMDARDLEGDPVVLPARGTGVLMLFTDTNCPLCERLRPQLGQFAHEHPDVELLLICSGENALVRDWARDVPKPVRVVADPTHRIGRYYDVTNLPFCVAVDHAGLVRVAGIVNTPRGLEEAVAVMQMAGQVKHQMIPGTAGS